MDQDEIHPPQVTIRVKEKLILVVHKALDESAGEQAKKIASERLRQINLNHSVHVEDTLDILCAREFGGIDLSGGIQRVVKV